jgi:hypothetical protein
MRVAENRKGSQAIQQKDSYAASDEVRPEKAI